MVRMIEYLNVGNTCSLVITTEVVISRFSDSCRDVIDACFGVLHDRSTMDGFDIWPQQAVSQKVHIKKK